MHIRLTIQLFALSLWLTACGGGQQTATEEVAESALPAWALGEFVRPEGKNPVITPNPESRFARCDRHRLAGRRVIRSIPLLW